MKRFAVNAVAVAMVLLAPIGANAKDGGVVYAQACALCHANGVGGAPKLTDKAEWGKRAAQGRDAMVTAVIKGKGAMPPKGGNASLSEDDVKAAVDHMLDKAK